MMLVSSSSPPSTPPSTNGDDDERFQDSCDLIGQRGLSPGASPTFRNKRRLDHLALKAEGTLASLALKTPLKPAETNQAGNVVKPCGFRNFGSRPPLARSSTLPVSIAPPSKPATSFRFAIPNLPKNTTAAAAAAAAAGPAFKIRRTSMNIDDEGEAQRIRRQVAQSSATSTIMNVMPTCRNTPSAPPFPSQGFSISGERLSIPHQSSGKDAVKRITAKTLTELIDGDYNHSLDEFIIVDCRFSYEYDGGHIKNALNFNTHDQILSRFFPNGLEHHFSDHSKHMAIIFHCEFSSHRGPRMALFLRSQDRIANGANYPNLHYPEIYILEGGYREFFKDFKEYCDPQAYIEMKDRAFKDDLRNEKMRRGGSYMRQNTASSFTNTGPSAASRGLQRSRTTFCISVSDGRTVSPIFNDLALQQKDSIDGIGGDLFQNPAFSLSPAASQDQPSLEDGLAFISTPARGLPKPKPKPLPFGTDDSRKKAHIFDFISVPSAAELQNVDSNADVKSNSNRNMAQLSKWGKTGKSGYDGVQSWSKRF